jgi:uncharacterized protein YdeI (BOF family)
VRRAAEHFAQPEANAPMEVAMHSNKMLIAITLGSLFAAPVQAGAKTDAAMDPYAKPDDSWISISGTVVNPKDDSFVLDYGQGTIIVEMDDWDEFGEAHTLIDGDRVTVYGDIDDGLFERRTIEAGSVYVEGLNTYFYASSTDEEGDAYTPYFWAVTEPLEPNRATLRGTVTSVEAGDREFTIDTGIQTVTVETEFLGYNPLDKLGFQQIEEGDRVSITGVFDRDFLEGRVFEADSVVTLFDESRAS